MPDLSTVTAQQRLSPRREPYWQKLGIGLSLGYRALANGGLGTWHVRIYDPATGRELRRSLGDFSTELPSRRFGAAKKAAELRFKDVSAGGSDEDLTVRQVCERYAVGNPDVARRFVQYVYCHEVSLVKIRKLRADHVVEWRRWLAELPALVTRHKSTARPQVTRKRTNSTINRDMTPFRAALNAAYRRGDVGSDMAWKNALKPVPRAERSRGVYLTREQRREMVGALEADIRAFVEVLCLLPVRPGALAKVRVRDLVPTQQVLIIEVDKAQASRRIRLPEKTFARLEKQARDKSPDDLLFSREDGMAWDKDRWKKPVRQAVESMGLPPGASIYAIRHSVITDLVTTGLDIFTVATLAGTSVRMIEKHYGHLQEAHAQAALDTLVLDP